MNPGQHDTMLGGLPAFLGGVQKVPQSGAMLDRNRTPFGTSTWSRFGRQHEVMLDVLRGLNMGSLGNIQGSNYKTCQHGAMLGEPQLRKKVPTWLQHGVTNFKKGSGSLILWPGWPSPKLLKAYLKQYIKA